MASRHTMDDLHELQSYPLNIKISLTKSRIREWVKHYGTDGVYVSFSGGKDSTVLLDIARSMYPDVKAVFCDTGLEYPEIRDFVMQHDNLTILKPKKNLRQVICEYGYPLFSKEVAECVSGARKYLTSILQEQNALTDRQTDRQTVPLQLRANYWNRIISSTSETEHITYSNTRRTDYLELADEQSKRKSSRGGYDNKYRKLRGIGEYSKQADDQQVRWKQSEISDHVRNAHERQETSDKGEYP